MKPLRFHLALWSMLLIFCAPFAYIATQEPGFVLSRENFGLILWRGGFRSWELHWCDGYELGHEKPKPVRIDKEGRIAGYGYRWIPRFSHADVNAFLKHHPEMVPVKAATNSEIFRVTIGDGLTNLVVTNYFQTQTNIAVYFSQSTNVWWVTSGTGPTYTRLQHLKMALGLKP